LAARRTTTRRKPTASRSTRTKRLLLTHDQWCNVHGIAVLVTAALSIPVLMLPQGSTLTEWLGVEGDGLLVVGLVLVGIRLLLRHGHASAAGVCIAIPGVLGMTALWGWTRGWAGQIGASLADSASSWVGPWWSVVAFVGLTCLGLVLAVDLDVPVVAGAVRDGMRHGLRSERLWGWIRGEEWGDAEPTEDAKPALAAPSGRDWKDVPWLAGPIRDAMRNPPRPVETPKHDTDDGQYPAGDSGQTALMVLPSTPPIDLLDASPVDAGQTQARTAALGKLITECLLDCGAPATIVDYTSGPAVTLFELQPERGVRVTKYKATGADLALALGAAVRIQAPIPGKALIGIEVPNVGRQFVSLRSVAQDPAFRLISAQSHVAVALGADTSGRPVVRDLARMPHLLIGGATNSGKSTLISAIMASLLLQSTPRQLRLLLIDPKRVELSGYDGIPHLLGPVVTEPEDALPALSGMVEEMEDRYRKMASLGVKDIDGYNALDAESPMPRIVVVIDELADLLLVSGKPVEEALCRIGGKGRAAGIHLIVATQSPRADVITGLLKANLPSAIALRVNSGLESRIILSEMGAEALSGPGDMLFRSMDDSKARRMQGALVTRKELDRLIGHWRGQRRG
jgi:DNA segregation ATPase FtsK/SpoIIIE-like protein